MKKFICCVFFLHLCCSFVYASPYLVSDPPVDLSVDGCVVSGMDWGLPCVLDTNKAIRVDLGSLPSGTYTVTGQFCTQGGLWCSEPSPPFTFTKPGLDVPKGLKVSK